MEDKQPSSNIKLLIGKNKLTNVNSVSKNPSTTSKVNSKYSNEADYLKAFDHDKLESMKELYKDLDKLSNRDQKKSIDLQPGVNLLAKLDQKAENMLMCKELYEKNTLY